MSKNRKAVKSIILISILFSGLFIVTAPPSSAKSLFGLVNLTMDVVVNFDTDKINETIITPKGAALVVPIDVTLQIGKGGILPGQILKELAIRAYSGEFIVVHLDVVSFPDEWASYSFSNNDPQFIINESAMSGDLLKKRITMYISVYEKAPAFEAEKIAIKATPTNLDKPLFPELKGNSKTFEFPFKAGYLPVITATPQVLTERIGPMDTAVFPIEVENIGNERTDIVFEIKHKPSGWKAIINNKDILEVGQKKTIYLSIQPPRTFGYHYDVESISITVTPARSIAPSVKGEPVPVTVQVESQGFSIVGIELLIIPLIIIIAIVVFLYYRFVHMKKLK